MGANFCHVNKRNLVDHIKPSFTSGNQKWKGAIPSFIRMADWSSRRDELKKFNEVKFNPLSSIDKAKINMVDANVWIIKYFIADSVE